MEEPIAKEEEEEGAGEKAGMSRKEKRKERKKMKRKQARKGVAEREREEEERKLKNPEEQRRVREMEEEEKERMERGRKEFEEKERKWMEEIERKRKEQEEEEKRRKEEEEREAKKLPQVEMEDDDDDWEYVEEGPAEIIWQGNEIIVRKKKVRVPKKSVDQQISEKDDVNRPTSNPLPPQSEAFAEYQNASIVSAQQMLENVAQQVPNFGTEQDKAHCPFHLKTGACRFGQRCSRVHFYPDKACTLLIKNMYSGPGLAWEQDEGLEYTDEEVERSYEEFYEDVHTEFLKYGEIVNFKVCRNGSFHLRGNVYVHYKSLDSALLAYHSINGRYFAAKQVKCEFVNVTRWKVAICGEYMKSRYKTCSHGMACNFIHCFRNPGGDYEWADWDKPPPRYWVKKMATLFGYSDETVYEKQMEQEKFGQLRTTSKTIMADADRHCARSRSRDMHRLTRSSCKSSDNEDDVQDGTRHRRHTNDDRTHESHSDGNELERVRDRGRGREKNRDHDCARKRSRDLSKVSEHSATYREGKNRTHEVDSNEELSDGDRKRRTHYEHTKSSDHRQKGALLDDNGDSNNRADGYHLGRSSKHRSKVRSRDDIGDCKSRNLDIDSSGKRSHRDRYRDRDRVRPHHHVRKSSGHQNNALAFSDDHWDDRYKSHATDSSDDQLDEDRERYQSHRRKHSRHGESEFSDDEKGTVKRLKEKSHSGESEIGKSHLKRNLDERCEPYDPDTRYNSIEEIDEQDRWKPESPERDWNSPGQCDRRSKSHDSSSDFSYKEKMHRGGSWESEKNASGSGKHHNSRSDRTEDDKNGGKSSSWDKNFVVPHKESRSRGRKQPRHEQHSQETDIPRMHQEKEEDNKFPVM